MIAGGINDRRGRRLLALPLAATMMAGPPSVEAAAPVKIVALGTSLTARGGWPGELAVALSRCKGRQVSVTRVALSGATSSWGWRQLEKVVDAAADVVLVEFAVNDAAIHNLMSLGQSRTNISGIVSALKAGDQPPQIYLMAMNPVHGAKAWLRPSLAAYETAHQEIAREQGVGFIDIGNAWRRLAEDERKRLIPDGLHPDPAKDAGIIVPTLVRSLAGVECRKAEATPWPR